ncbi:hypothetical protein [Enterococcus faecium]|uniref:hypothetical protein n=1 Tax=Enterococcus faecium TaxID=1352 RepID=UPI001021AB1E|nr:hypothetical protein [Enterococcus faecium]EME7220928.1 hypothetical protein [Enterococcus faecium]RYK14687.1 hypothetical protein EWH89_07190 [Enterococcus faecium]RYK34562.1 hypothetical protein EWH94_07230 [Enterococcus faecium]RYK65340.1 hypothetical protein EWI01_12480 [Enterococcus faecium]
MENLKDNKVISNDNILERLIEAKWQFDKHEYKQEEKELFTLEDTIYIANTDEVYDSEELMEYEIQCTLNLKDKLDIYQITNEYISVRILQPMTYEEMINNLNRGDFDSWVSSENGLDYDILTDMILDYKNGIEKNRIIEKYGLNQLCRRIEINFT